MESLFINTRETFGDDDMQGYLSKEEAIIAAMTGINAEIFDVLEFAEDNDYKLESEKIGTLITEMQQAMKGKFVVEFVEKKLSLAK